MPVFASTDLSHPVWQLSSSTRAISCYLEVIAYHWEHLCCTHRFPVEDLVCVCWPWQLMSGSVHWFGSWPDCLLKNKSWGLMHHCFVYQLQQEHPPSLISVSCYNRDVKKCRNPEEAAPSCHYFCFWHKNTHMSLEIRGYLVRNTQYRGAVSNSGSLHSTEEKCLMDTGVFVS